jgi:hypothetical protein
MEIYNNDISECDYTMGNNGMENEENIRKLFATAIDRLKEKGIDSPILDRIREFLTTNDKPTYSMPDLNQYLSDLKEHNVRLTTMDDAKEAFYHFVMKLVDYADKLADDGIIDREDAVHFAEAWDKLFSIKPYDEDRFIMKFKIILLQLKSYVKP